jgi:membrane dipeptidase
MKPSLLAPMSESLKRAILRLSLGTIMMTAMTPAAAEPPVSSRDRVLHERLLVLDTHLDTPANLERNGWDIMQSHAHEGLFSQVDVPRMRAGGLDGGFWVIFTPQGPLTAAGFAAARDAAILRAMRIREMVAGHSDTFEMAVRAADAERIVRSGRLVVYQSIENSYPLGEDISLLKTFYDLGVRMAAPVHGANNQFADSATDRERRWGGLSPLGRTWVQEANRLGILIDGSHASDETIEQLVELSKTPIILSHHGAKAVFDHPRNLDDDRLRKVAASGGVVQINSMYVFGGTNYPELRAKQGALRFQLSRWSQLNPMERKALANEIAALDETYPNWRGSFDDYMANILHVLKVVGPDHVGMGADWDGGGGVRGFDSVAELPRITARLRAAGYSEADLAKIWGGNVLRLLAQAEAYQDSLALPSPK